MARTSTIFARVEPEIKSQAETVLKQLGIPMSNAIGLFLRQIVLQCGIPFEMKLPQSKPITFVKLSETEFNAEIDKGLSDLTAGRVLCADDVIGDIRRYYLRKEHKHD
jgi:DNA-damage-inducible protein J